MLSSIAKVLFAKIVKEKESPSTFDVNSFNTTMANITKIEGWNAPAKVAQTDSDGKDVPIINLIPASLLTKEQIKKLTNE